MSRQIRFFLKPHTFLHETALRPHETSESDHRNHRSPEWLKTPVRVHTSLLESSSNARLCGEGLHDDTKNRCLTHYVHMNPEKLCRFKNGQIRVNIAFETYSGTHKRIPCVPGGIRVWGCFMGRSAAVHKKPLERSSCELQIPQATQVTPGADAQKSKFHNSWLDMHLIIFLSSHYIHWFFFFEKLVIQIVERGRK